MGTIRFHWFLLSGLAACTAQTNVRLLEDCDTPGQPCGSGLICSADHQCVVEDRLRIDAGDASSYDGGMFELPDGGLAELLAGACATGESKSDPLPTSLMLVVDVSGSMNERAPGGGTRWEVTRDALEVALEALPSTTEVGMLLYPNRRTETGYYARDPSECIAVEEMVPIAPLGSHLSEQRQALEEALHHADVDESTPTHDAYVVARQELEQSARAGNRHLLLITDGQPTLLRGCIGTPTNDAVDERPIIAEIELAAMSGTRTFVIGSPGSEETNQEGDDARTWLSMAAFAGQTARLYCSHAGPMYCHFDMVDEPDFSVALERALSDISGEIVPCEYDLPKPEGDQSIDPEAVNVVWTPGDGTDRLFLRNDAPDCIEGWTYNAMGSRIELCGQSCDRVQESPESELTLIFGCATEVALF